MVLDKGPITSNLAELVERILDKGIVIDAWIRVSVIGIQLLTIEARVVVTSVETYLKYAQAIGITSSVSMGLETLSQQALPQQALPQSSAPASLADSVAAIAAPVLNTAAGLVPEITNAGDVISNVLQNTVVKAKE